MFDEATIAIEKMNKSEISELKNAKDPPAEVKGVISACMVLLGRPTDWDEARKEVGRSNFIDSIKHFDKDSISAQTMRTL